VWRRRGKAIVLCLHRRRHGDIESSTFEASLMKYLSSLELPEGEEYNQDNQMGVLKSLGMVP
jgi:hypothetical protein